VITELAERTGLSGLQLKKRIDWWCSKGFLSPGGLDPIMLEETYCLCASNKSIESLAKQVGEFDCFIFNIKFLI
jgi:hypothetical protein